jgi:hypothetical protein
MESKKATFQLRPMTKKDLMAFYGVSIRVINNLLGEVNELGEKKGKFYTLKQVEKIIDHIGLPKKIEIE